MTIRSLKLIFLPATLLTLLLPALAGADNDVKVGVFPFAVHADKKMEYLNEKIPLMVIDHLKKEGAESFYIDDPSVTPDTDADKLKKLGIKYGADYLVYGSIFSAGGGISIDTRMVGVYEDDIDHTFYSEAKGMENLSGASRELSKKVTSEIFKKKIIESIEVEGNKRIESDAVIRTIETQVRDVVNSERLSDDLSRIYKMGYFEDVRVSQENLGAGVKIIFKVEEKPSVRKILFEKNHVYDNEKLREAIHTSTGSILNVFKIKEDLKRIEHLYKTKNYHNCEISYEVNQLEQNQADIVFRVDEGEKLKIEDISFEGNEHFDDKDLKKRMKTKEKGFFHWITSSGDLDRNELERDVLRIESFYKNNGYIDARISEPEIEFQEKSISISFEVEEGTQFKIGKIDLKGDLILPESEIMEKLEFKESGMYNRELIRKGVFDLTDAYANKGFANADISPAIDKDEEKGVVDITLVIKKGSPVYFERVMISGNTKTRDKVIRRQLKVYDKGLYSKKDIQRSMRNLRRLDYFEEVDLEPVKGSRENTMNLNVDVKEKSTGAFTFGGGYSSDTELFGLVSVREKNLFGRGQEAEVKAEVSDESSKFMLSFTEPWLFDIPLRSGIELYNWEKEYDHYDKDSKGGALKFSYPVFDYTRVGMKYGFEDFEISNVDEKYTSVDKGTYVTSSLMPFISRDSRDQTFVPTEGSLNKISVEYAGGPLGGEIDFIKYYVETGWYFPLFWKLTGVLHAEGGYLDDQTDGDTDIDYERFYLGGINSIRGFDSGDIDATPKGQLEERGGEKYVQFNAEITFPLAEDMGLTGVVFYDQGDVYKDGEDIDLGDNFSSYGAGLRWKSPVGPIRIEYGRVLEGHDVESSGSGRWQFTVGAFF
ncbi:MAG: outer membrane protein assembly factor BamA [Desulfobacteraceae bacterium]